MKKLLLGLSLLLSMGVLLGRAESPDVSKGIPLDSKIIPCPAQKKIVALLLDISGETTIVLFFQEKVLVIYNKTTAWMASPPEEIPLALLKERYSTPCDIVKNLTAM